MELASELSTEEKEVIKRFANGDESVRDDAISLYRDFVFRSGVSRGTPFLNFMSEVDTPVPDLGLRARYREAVCEAETAPKPPVSRGFRFFGR